MNCQALQNFFVEEQQRLDRLKSAVQGCPVSIPSTTELSYQPILFSPPNPDATPSNRIEMFTLSKEPVPGQYVRIRRIKPAPKHAFARIKSR